MPDSAIPALGSAGSHYRTIRHIRPRSRKVRRRFEEKRAALPPEPPVPYYIEQYAANDAEHGYDLPTKHGGPAGPGNPHYFPNEAAAWRFYERAIEPFRERLTKSGRRYTMKPYTRKKRPGL
jgi:hypothetical protein